MKQIKTNHKALDIIAISSAILCALHCVALPILFSFSAFTGLYFLHNPLIEWFFIVFGALLILLSLWPSFHKIHRSKAPLLFAGIGFLIILGSRFNFTQWWEATSVTFGTALVIYAHFKNWRLLSTTDHEH